MKFIDELKTMLDSQQRVDHRNKIVAFVSDDKLKWKAFMDLFLNDKWHWRYNQRAAWALGVLGRKFPDCIGPYHEQLVDKLSHSTHDAQVRNILRIYADIAIPETIEGELYEKCFSFLADTKNPIAIRCFSMTVMERVADKYPDLRPELVAEIEEHLPYGSSGFKNRGHKIVNKFKQ
jgi:hypothetical protein